MSNDPVPPPTPAFQAEGVRQEEPSEKYAQREFCFQQMAALILARMP
jgi:hypothetical protein